jgi:hypothetical protein
MVQLRLSSNGNNSPTQPPHPQPLWSLPTYSPTALNQHANCPEAFLHERVLKTPAAPDPGGAALAKGSAAHALLDRYVGLDPAARARFTADLAAEAARTLAATLPAPVDRATQKQAVAEVVAWVAYGAGIVDTEFAAAKALVGEQFLDLAWHRDPAPFRLTAKIDLLAVHGNGVVESLDWKTGAPRGPDHLQNVICRLVTEANASRLFGRHLPNAVPTEIRTSVCHLGTRTMSVQVFDRAQLVAEFAAIRERIARIERAKIVPTPGSPEWRTQPGWLCRYCKYAHACSHQTPHADGGAMAWLDVTSDPALGEPSPGHGVR